jgi:hypothetical protein
MRAEPWQHARNTHALNADAASAICRLIFDSYAGEDADVRTASCGTSASPQPLVQQAPRITRLLNLSLFVERLIARSRIFHVVNRARAVGSFVCTLSGVLTLRRVCAASKARARLTRSNQYRRCFPRM